MTDNTNSVLDFSPKINMSRNPFDDPILTSPFNDDHVDDNSSVLVIILQGETRKCDQNITNLKWLFSDPYFTVQVCAVDPPSIYPDIKSLSQQQYFENYSMRKVLTYASEGPYITDSSGQLSPQYLWRDLPVIIVKDSSVSNLSSTGLTNFIHSDNTDLRAIGGIKHRIKTALSHAKQADLFFLCKWNDACDKYTDVDNYNNVNLGSSLKWSLRPTSTQAIMYTPSSRNYIIQSLLSASLPLSDIINSNISKGNLLATVFVPNIIDFDIDLAVSNSDYNKLNECAPVPVSTTNTDNTSSIIWFIIIIIIILLSAWFLMQMSQSFIY